MRRGAKPAKAKVEAQLPVARKSPKKEASRGRQLEKRLAEALEQQTATSEILRMIASSPTDLEPVFNSLPELWHPCHAGQEVLPVLRRRTHYRAAVPVRFPVTVVAVPVGNKFQATGFIEAETGASGSTPAKPAR